MRCRQARRSSISAQYNRPRVRTSSTCPGGIHDSGNRPCNSNVRNNRASARSVFARFFRTPQTCGLGRISQMRRRTRRGQLLDHIPPPGAALYRDLRVPGRAVLAQPAPQRRAGSRTDLPAAHQPGTGIHVVERDLLPMHVKSAYHRHWDLLKLPKKLRRKLNERLS